MPRTLTFDFRRGGGSPVEFLYGEVSLEPTSMFNSGTSVVLPTATKFPLVNGVATAAEVAESPAGPIPAWAYKVTVRDSQTGRAWGRIVGVPAGAGAVNFKDLPAFDQVAPGTASSIVGLVNAPADEVIAAAINGSGTQSTAAIAARIATEAQARVPALVVSAIAADPTVVNAAAAAVDANPKIDALSAKQPVKCVRLEAGKWVWDTTNGTHYVIRDWLDGSLVVRPTAQPVPATTPALNW